MSLPKFSAGHILPWSYTGPHDDQVNGGTFFTLRDAMGAWIGDVRTRPLADMLVDLANVSCETVLTSARLRAEGATEEARRAINLWGRDGPPVVEEVARELHDIAETLMEQCDGKWVATRKQVADCIIAQVKRLRTGISAAGASLAR